MPSVQIAAPGLHGFDADTAISGAAAAAFNEQGFQFCIRYLSRTSPQASGDLSSSEVQAILASGLSLMAIQHVSKPGWVPDATLGQQYGATAAANADSVGFPAGVNVWLDLEGIKSGVDSEDVIAYCNAWFDEVAAAGFVPGVYVGADCILDGDALFWRLKTQHYWRSGSTTPDIPQRGYQLVQRITSAPDVVNGIAIDRNITMNDEFGDSVLWLSP